MAQILDSIIEAVGNTPLVRLNRVVPNHDAEIVAKLEFLNPLSSIKDRVGEAMIEDALATGRINEDSVLIDRLAAIPVLLSPSSRPSKA